MKIKKGTDVIYSGKVYKVKDVRVLHLMTLIGLQIEEDRLTHIWIGEVEPV
jgi:hypothetical protein|tara:strand:- start:293 stop:445 length:153 start_codon:yes stop_codon:yes gene_type:complete